MLRGILLKILSTLFFTLMAVSVKWLGTRHPLAEMPPVGQVVFFRSFFALLPLLAWIIWQGQLRAAVTTRNLPGHVRRSLTGILGMFSGFAGLTILPLADATVISYASPLIVVILAAVLLREQVRIYRWTAVALGFLGVVIAMMPHLAILGGNPVSARGAMLAFGGAVMAAFAMIEVRKLTATDGTASIVFYFSVFSSLAGLLTLPLGFAVPGWAWTLPSTEDFLILSLVGIFGGLGQITLTASYRKADASVIAPFEYVSIVWATAIGFLAFADVPGRSVIIGSVIVVLAGLFVIYREHRLGLERRRPLEAAPQRPV